MSGAAQDEEMVPAIPSGTVAILRDGPEGLEVLMLRRAAHERDVFSGLWVFPGGKVEAEDQQSGGEREVARRAARRETQEEAGLELPLESLVVLDRWEPEARPGMQRRFSAWIFLAPASEAAGSIDGQEIHEHDWVRPAEAIRRHAAAEMGISPPTWVTLHKLADHASAAAALSWAADRQPDNFLSRILEVEGGPLIVWRGDELNEGPPGGRHRLWMQPGAWRYEREG